MSTTMNDLVGIVRVQIRDNCPTQVFPDVVDDTLATPAIVPNNSPELTQFVQEALGEFSRYRPLKKPITLNVTAGQTTYNLPSDWITADMVAFEQATQPSPLPEIWEYQLPQIQISPVLGSQQAAMQFEWYDDLRQIVLNVKPIREYSLSFAYHAMHTPSTLPAQYVMTAMAVACEKALRAIATDQAVKIQQYKIANSIEVDNRTIADKLLAQAEAYRERFRREVVMRPFGAQGGADSLGHRM